MGEEEQIILPDEFERVEWIENPISSNTSTNGKIILPLDFKFYKDGSGDSSLVFETEHAFSSVSFTQVEGVINGSGSEENNQEFNWMIYNGYFSVHSGGFISFNDLKPKIDEFWKVRLEWTPSLVTFTISYGGQTYSKSIAPNSTWDCSEIGLFHKLTGKTSGSHFLSGKKKYCKIWKNGELIYDLVPCIEKENDEACMYDLVSQQAFRNQGDGKFLTNKDYKWKYPLLNNSYNLPAGFKKCVYLQSDGTQWIDTGVLPNNETGIFCKTIKFDSSSTSMFGVRENDSTTIMTPYVSGKTISYRWKAEGKNNIYTLDKAGDYIFSSFLNFYNDRLAKIDSEDTDWATILSGILENYTRSIWLFSTNFQGTFNNTYGKYVGRIYRAQITQGDTLIHDYVPCLDANNRPCMYDLIEQETLYNQSGGEEFEYCLEHQLPSDFIKLKYLEASGTQYIKTGYVPTNNTGLYVDAYSVIEGGTNGVQTGVSMSIRQTNGNTYFSAPRLGKTSSYQTGYGWNSFTSLGGYGDSRYEGYLNWLNNKKYNVKSPLYVEKVGNLSNLSFTPTFDLCMFGNHNYDGKYIGSGYRIYRVKISEGSEIVRDYVPAFDELKLKPCMYDLINNVAYYNDGEGEFLTNRDFEGTYKGYTGLSGIGNRLSGNCYHLVNALITDGNCRIDLGKGIIDSDISHDFRGYTTNSKKFMFGTSTNGPDYFWQGDGILAWGGIICTVTSNSDIIVVVDDKNNKVRYNNRIITKNANFTSNKQTSIFDVGRYDTEKKYIPAANGSKFYKWVMKKDDEIIHDYRPAIDIDFVPCVIDLITGEAFYNTLTGTLTWE